MLTSKVTQKGQVTLPLQVRSRLEIKTGDQIVYETTGEGFLIRKVQPFDAACHEGIQKSLETEWDSPEDTEDFSGL